MTDPQAEALPPLTAEELAALSDADLSDDPTLIRVLAVLERANEAGLVFGGNPTYTIDPSGWTKSTLPAVASLIAAALTPATTSGGLGLRKALDKTIAVIDDPTKYIEVNTHYRAGWIDALTALREEPHDL